MNKSILLGRLGKDPELSMTQSGIKRCTFSLAVERRGKSGEEKVTDWIDCVAWRERAEFIAGHFAKGQRMLVAGALQVRKWETQEGEKRKVTELIVDEVDFVDPKRDTPIAPADVPAPAQTAEADDTSLPFDL